MKKLTVGSVCSGIEACSVAWKDLAFDVVWLSEIAPFQQKLLKEKYPNIPNLGDMNAIPNLIANEKIPFTDVICAGTPCQAFSYAGWQRGLCDARGNLTLKFVDIVNMNDQVRFEHGLNRSTVFWENVEGVLKDKTNAFGNFLALMVGADKPFECSKWSNAGLIRGPLRNVAWRVLDARYFGLPQQRRRLYVIATGKDKNPEDILFETFEIHKIKQKNAQMTFQKKGNSFEIFREYTDCLYSAYGTKWNGNAAARNGSLFIVQNKRIRRFSPLECERLMGFPDNYTNIEGAKKTNRYQTLGNSWAIPVVTWIGRKILNPQTCSHAFNTNNAFSLKEKLTDVDMWLLNNGYMENSNVTINSSEKPNVCSIKNVEDIVDCDAPDDIYISPVGCYGIVRRKNERNAKINPRLEEVLKSIANQMSLEEIEAKSKVQQRGKFSLVHQETSLLT